MRDAPRLRRSFAQRGQEIHYNNYLKYGKHGILMNRAKYPTNLLSRRPRNSIILISAGSFDHAQRLKSDPSSARKGPANHFTFLPVPWLFVCGLTGDGGNDPSLVELAKQGFRDS
jgi:hypothetical protein